MKKILSVVLMVLLAGYARGFTNPDPIKYSKVERYVFRNGVSPDAGFSGMTMLQINQNARTTNYKTWTFATLGDTAATSAPRFRTLWKCDVSAIPDSALVQRAVLRVALAYSTSPTTFRIQGYRVLLDWTENATWNTRGLTPVDTTWTVNNASAGITNWGLADSILSMSDYRGSSLNLVSGHSGKWPINTSTNYSGMEGGYYTLAGIDSLHDSEQIPSTYAARENEALFDKLIQINGTILNDTTWVEFDLTEAVAKWKSNHWANFGIVMTAEKIDTESGATCDSHLDNDPNTYFATRPRMVTPKYVGYNNANSLLRRPALVVDLLLAVDVPPDTVQVEGPSRGSSGVTLGVE